MLSELGVTGTWSWKDCERIIQYEERTKALKAIHEQKRAFNEFIAEYKQRERDEARQKRKHLKDQFKQMLDESKVIYSTSKYCEVYFNNGLIDSKMVC